MLTRIVLFIVDRFGRRPILIIGAVGALIAMYYLAGYSAISGSFDHAIKSDGGSRAALGMVYIFGICHSLSWTGIPWIFAAEVMPNKVRTIGMMCAVCMQWLAQFLVVYSLPYMLVGIKWGAFVFFGTCTVAALVFAYLFVPETKGVPLEGKSLSTPLTRGSTDGARHGSSIWRGCPNLGHSCSKALRRN